MENIEFTFKVYDEPFFKLSARKNFPNRWGVSIILGKYTYGGCQLLWELAVLYDDEINYTSMLTSDVIGYLTMTEVQELTKQVASW
ncbi:MAG: hypothetical protein ACK6DA_11875 [Candidatus Kapaibacterium sp.]|jgi:hypothetical protein